MIATPCIKPGCRITQLPPQTLRIENGPFEVLLELPEPASERALRVLDDRPTDPDLFRETLGEVLDADEASVEGAIQSLARLGVVTEHPERPREHYPGEYIAYRLLDRRRLRFLEVAGKHPLCDALAEPGRRDLALGMLLESYFHMRGARQITVAVLARELTARQRELLEDLFLDERTHAEQVVDGFALVGLDPDRVRRALAAPATQLLESFFVACGHRSVATFAAAMMVPEAPMFPPGAEVVDPLPDLLHLAEHVQGLPGALLAGFRRHAEVNELHRHGDVAVEVLAEAGTFTREQVAGLVATLDYAVDATGLYLSGIEQRYRSWDGQLVLPPTIA